MIKKFLRDNKIHKKIAPSLDLFFLFRPTLFFAVWVMICIGMYLAHLEFENYPQWITTINIKTLLLFLSLSFIIGASFITNQLKDIDSDNENKKIFLLNGILDQKIVLNSYKFSCILGIGLILFTNIYNLIIGLLIFFIWDILYNKNQFKWGDHPILGPISNMSIGFLLMLSGWLIIVGNNQYFFSINNLVSSTFLIRVIPYSLCYLSVSLLTDIPDEKGDNKFEKKSFSITYGRNATIIIATLLVLMALILGIYLVDPLLSISTICSFPFFLYATIRNQNKDILRAIRYPIFILNFFVATIYPYLCILLISIFYISKYYYWHRFNLHYPTFLVNND